MHGDFPDGPMAGDVGSIPDGGGGRGGAEILHSRSPKNQNINNRSNVVTNSIKTLKNIDAQSLSTGHQALR